MSEKNRVFKNENNNWSIHTEIEINASPKRVWKVLTDFDSMKQWSTSLKWVEKLEDGAKSKVIFRTMGRDMNLTHTMRVKEGVSFGWSDRMFPGARDNHTYTVQAKQGDASATVFTQTDSFSGPMSRVLGKRMASSFVKLYDEFNRLLKEQVERVD